MLIEMRRLRRELAPIRAAEAARLRCPSADGHRQRAPISMRNIHARAGAILLCAIAGVALLLGWLATLFLEGAARSLFDGLLPDPVRIAVSAMVALIT